MNLDNPISSCRHRIVSPKTIPLLVLVKEWSSRQEEAMMDTRCILYLLQVLQKVLSKHETDLTLNSMLESIRNIISMERYKRYILSLNSLCVNLPSLTDLFKHLNSLLSSSDEGKDPLLDEKNGVIGGFIRRCVQEYLKMTFSQTVELQKQWQCFYSNSDNWNQSLKIRMKSSRELLTEAKQNKDYSSAMEKLMLPSPKPGAMTKMSVELKALHLAMLLTQFEHLDECKVVLKEAIRMAQMSDNTLVLEHSMALLQRLTPVQPATSKPMITQLIKNAQKHKENLLISTGKLQMAKAELQLNSDPVRVLDVVQSSEFDVFNCYDDYNHKSAVRSSTLLFRASVLRQYGMRYLAVLPLQLLCYMMPHKNAHSNHRTLDECKAISILALMLSEEGRLNDALTMVQNGLQHFKASGSDAKFLHQCLAELNLVNFHHHDPLKCQGFLKELAVFDPPYAHYWKARLSVQCQHFADAMMHCEEEINKLSTNDDKVVKQDDHVLKARYQILEIEVLTKESLYSRAIKIALECLAFCKKHQLWDVVTTIKLKIAMLQLHLGLLCQSEATIKEVLPIVMAHGQASEKALAFFTLAEVRLLKDKESFVTQKKFNYTVIRDGLHYLTMSLDEVRHSVPTPPITEKILTLKQILEAQLNLH